MKTLYDVLGVRRDADPETIKTAFRRAVKAHHPDLQGGDAAASERIKLIIAANEVLSDPERRAAYDEDLAFDRALALSECLTVIIRSASALAVLGLALIGAIELWAAWTGMPVGDVRWTTPYWEEIASAVLPEPIPPAGGSTGRDTQPAGEPTSGEARPVPHSTTPESGSGVAEAETAADVPAINASPADDALPTTAASYRERAIDWSKKGDLNKAIADLDQAVRLAPDDAQAYHDRGNAWGRKGDTDRALADFERALQIEPHDPGIFRDRALMWQRKGELDKALGDLDHAVRMSFTDPEVYTDRGAVWFEKGRYDRALADFDRAIKINPNLVIAYARRADVLERKGDQEHARADRDQATQLDHGTLGAIQKDIGPTLDKDH
jgi:tetratricopeptide (TPR) repeat protein